MSEFLHSELFAVTLTIGLFWGAQLIQKKLRSVILNPILVAINSDYPHTESRQYIL